ncbi:hypothetical protein AWB78_04380 [Caballeronia calidae]|uniref:Uncharacterized protein n=1 Tax=Caballeronia calidae TaxID=1777139 RepID=A0A158CUC8_9BURK|nr:hypothetical protein AWB78_04380 [Caballeronia calidae]
MQLFHVKKPSRCVYGFVKVEKSGYPLRVAYLRRLRTHV